ncbi:MAG TPA: hypothetical protein VEK56_03005 [Vicinamibacterales bacterium]|nr:hypothetical protein [Vicinamibacterales bacterium]
MKRAVLAAIAVIEEAIRLEEALRIDPRHENAQAKSRSSRPVADAGQQRGASEGGQPRLTLAYV